MKLKDNIKKDVVEKYDKILKIMKISIVLLFICTFGLVAKNVHSQDKSLSLKITNSTIEKVISNIEKENGYVFIYNEDVVSELKRRASLQAKEENIADVLDKLFNGTNLAYNIIGKQITVYKKQTAPKEPTVAAPAIQPEQQTGKTVTGTIIDTHGDPVIGATIVVQGDATKGTVTDTDGKYTLTNVPDNATLSITYVGMKPQSIAIGNRTKVDIVMQEDTELLDDVVVVGFGVQKKASVVGAIQTIKPSELRVPASNLSAAFAGRIAGITSVQRSGEPGADGASFWIRGISTFANQTSPLIFIDGVEVSAADMNALAPEVIENFSVLKDATATALYGARGANGVMLITTRQGRKMERAQINIRIENSFTAPTQTFALADGVDYMRAYNNAIVNRNAASPPRFSDEKIQNTINRVDPMVFPNIDWQDVLFKKSSIKQAANVNIIGGGDKVTYFMSASFNNDIGMFKKDPFNKFDNNVKNQRIALQGNITAKLTPTTKVTLRLNNQIVKTGGTAAGTETVYSEIFYAPPVLFPVVYPAVKGEDHILFGNARGGPLPTGSGDNIYRNPYATMVKGYSDRTQSTSISTLEAEQDLKFITEGLRLKGLISFKNWSSTTVTRQFTPFYYAMDNYKLVDNTYKYEYGVVTKGTTALNTTTANTGDRLMNAQVNLDYARTFGLHDVSAMFVYLQRDYNSNAPGNFYATLPTRNQGIAGRITYGYDNRYMIEANFGYNGSENFETGKRWGFFPSVAVGYNISNEAYFEPLRNVVSQLKIRGSYGIVGNSATESRFPYLTEVNLEGKQYIFGFNWEDTAKGATVTKYGAAGAAWEIGRKSNIGIDLELFRSFSITADVFREVRTGIFMQRRVIPAESGVVGSNPYANLGKVKNEGLDLALNYNKAFGKDLIINLRANVTYNKNTLLDRDEPQLPYPYLSDLNQPLNRHKGLVAIGLFKDEEDIKNSPRQTYGAYLPGDIKYKDLNEDGKIDDLDRIQLGNPTVPELVYGFGGSLQFKAFDFSLFFQGIGKSSLMMSDIHPFVPDQSVLFKFIADDYWTQENPNPNAQYPRLMHGTISHNNYRNSTYWLRDASFLRLKNIEIGYSYKMARLYLSGQNLLTFTPFKNWDPEVGGGNGLKYPLQKLVNIGLQLTF